MCSTRIIKVRLYPTVHLGTLNLVPPCGYHIKIFALRISLLKQPKSYPWFVDGGVAFLERKKLLFVKIWNFQMKNK
jgi:hypothetical protein